MRSAFLSAFVILATHLSVAPATAQVASTSPPAQELRIPLVLVRIDGRTGDALVSNAIPLPPGMLRPENIASVRVFVQGTEQTLYVEALKGLYRDSTLRSVLVQFEHLAMARSLPAELVIGTPRQTPDRAKTPISYSMENPVPEAVVLPSDPDYLIGTGIVGPTVGLAEADAFDPIWQRRFHSIGDPKWELFERQYTTQSVDLVVYRNYYDRALINFAYWVRSADPEYFRRGVLYAMAYIERYYKPNEYRVQPHQIQIEGVALLYRLLGDEDAWRGVRANAEYLRDSWLPKLKNRMWKWSEPRPEARTINAFLAALKLGVPGGWKDALHKSLDYFLPQQDADGAYRYPNTCMASSNFMSGLFNDALIRYWEVFEQDPRIPVVIRKNIDWMWNTQWLRAAGAFKYYENSCRTPNGGGGGPEPAADLNLMIVNGFGFIYQLTHDPLYRQRGDEIFHRGIREAWLGNTAGQGDKQFNEQYRSSFRYLWYRR